MRGVGDRRTSLEGIEGRVRRPGRLGSLSDRERLGRWVPVHVRPGEFFWRGSK